MPLNLIKELRELAPHGVAGNRRVCMAMNEAADEIEKLRYVLDRVGYNADGGEFNAQLINSKFSQ